MSDYFEKQFKNEFTTLMSQIRNETKLELNKLPIPFQKPVLVSKLYVNGIVDEHYKLLNEKFVIKRAKNSFERNLYKNRGEVKGKVLYKAKEGNLLVVTTESLRLPFNYKPSDKALEYVDFRNENNVRYFIYSVPRKYLYKVEQTALVLSANPKRSNHYGGLKIVLTNGHSIYLYIVPLSNVRRQEGNIPIVTKNGIDYGKELTQLQSFWLQRGIIFDRNRLELNIPHKDSSNLGYQKIEPILTYTGIDEFSLEERAQMGRTKAY